MTQITRQLLCEGDKGRNLKGTARMRGDDLRNQIAQHEGRKVKTNLCEFYCLRCRKGCAPAVKMADCKIEGNKAMLTALCDVCETIVCKPISLASAPEVRMKLDLTTTRVEVTL